MTGSVTSKREGGCTQLQLRIFQCLGLKYTPKECCHGDKTHAKFRKVLMKTGWSCHMVLNIKHEWQSPLS